MGIVVRFSDFDNYLDDLKSRGIDVKGTILDANVIITLTYSPKKFHTRIFKFVASKIINNDINLYTTVNTTQEYLEFYRRLLLTEGLRTALHSSSEINLPDKEREIIRRQSTILQKREQKDEIDPVFFDREIKKIRQSFYSRGEVGLEFWKYLCNEYLKRQLKLEYEVLGKLKINYLSSYSDEGKCFFHKGITWEGAMDICSGIGAGFSDSMILNALQCSSFPFSISLDTDMAFSVLGNSSLKDIVMPDGIIEKNEALSRIL